MDFIIVVALDHCERDAAVRKDLQHNRRGRPRVFAGFRLVFAGESVGGNAVKERTGVGALVAHAQIRHQIAGEHDQIGLCRPDRCFQKRFELFGRVLVVLCVGQMQNRERAVGAKLQLLCSRFSRSGERNRAKTDQQAAKDGQCGSDAFHGSSSRLFNRRHGRLLQRFRYAFSRFHTRRESRRCADRSSP